MTKNSENELKFLGLTLYKKFAFVTRPKENFVTLGTDKLLSFCELLLCSQGRLGLRGVFNVGL